MKRTADTSSSVPILAAARRRFLQWGYSGTSTAALAEDLGLTKAALYYHFPDKEALFLAVVKDYLGEVAGDLQKLPPLFEGSDRRQALEALAEVFLSRNATSAQMQQLTFQESRHLSPEGKATLSATYHDTMVRPLAGLLDQAVGKGWIRAAGPDEPAALWIFLGLLTAFLKPGHEDLGTGHRSTQAFVGLFLSALKGDAEC